MPVEGDRDLSAPTVPSSDPTFSVVVLHYERGSEFRDMLRGLPALGAKEVVIVDNSPSANDVEEWCATYDLAYVRPGANLGYGAGMNLGFSSLTEPTDYVLFLTHEVSIGPADVRELIASAELHAAAVVGPVLELPGGRRWSAGGAFGRFGSVLHHQECRVDRPVTWLDGAALMVSRKAFEVVDGFDTDFFLYWEDVDLCLRLQAAGGCWISSRARAEQQTGLTPPKFRERNAVLLWRKHSRPGFVLAALIRAALRDLKAVIRGDFRRSHLVSALAGALRTRTDTRPQTRLSRPTTVELVNPLPRALNHYEQEVRLNLAESGIDVLGEAEAVSIERAGSDGARRFRRAISILRVRSQTRGRTDPLLVLWPAFGLLDLLTWWRTGRRRSVFVVVHDPCPLGREFGSGRVARLLAGLAFVWSDVKVVVHSEEALADLPRTVRAVAVKVPLPFWAASERGVLAGEEPVGSQTQVIRVLGMAKPSRDLDALRQIAEALPEVRKEIIGEGWSAVTGWTVVSRFLSEDEFVQAIRQSSCIVVPYRRFYQSGVVVRAIENGVPFVAPLQSQTSDLAPGYVGLVSAEQSWAEACAAVLRLSEEAVEQMTIKAQADAVAGWRLVPALAGVALS